MIVVSFSTKRVGQRIFVFGLAKIYNENGSVDRETDPYGDLCSNDEIRPERIIQDTTTSC